MEVEHIPDDSTSVTEKECPSCGATVNATDDECFICGFTFADADDAVAEPEFEESVEAVSACPSCGNQVEEGATECLSCGAQFDMMDVGSIYSPDDTGEAYIEEGTVADLEEESPEPTPGDTMVEETPEEPAPPEEEGNTCPECGMELEPGAAECFMCGHQLGLEGIPEAPEAPEESTPAEEAGPEPVDVPDAQPSTPEEGKMPCPSCQSLIDIDYDKCPECWTDLSLYQACKECHTLLPVDAASCNVCYAAVEQLDAVEEEETMDEPVEESGMELDPDSPMNLQIEEVVVSEELEQEMATLEQQDEMQRECLVCGALLADDDIDCPVCRIEYGVEIEAIPEPERMFEGVEVLVEPTAHQCPNCDARIVGMEPSGREIKEQKWFFYGIITIFIGIFFTSFSVWLRGMTAENQSLGLRPPPLDVVVNAIGWIMVGVGFMFWYFSWRVKSERLECPTCGVEITADTDICINCGSIFREPEEEMGIPEDADVETLADEILEDEVVDIPVADAAIEPEQDTEPIKDDDTLIQEDLVAIEEEFGQTEEGEYEESVPDAEAIVEEPVPEIEEAMPEPETEEPEAGDVPVPAPPPSEEEEMAALEGEPVVDEEDSPEAGEMPAEPVPPVAPEPSVPEEDVGAELPTEHEEHKECPGCGIFVDADVEVCPVCDTPFTAEEEVEQVADEAGPPPLPVDDEGLPPMEEQPAEALVDLPVEREVNGMTECPSCGAAVETTDKECFMCGYDLEGAEPGPPPAEDSFTQECPSCGAILTERATECPICEEKIDL